MAQDLTEELFKIADAAAEARNRIRDEKLQKSLAAIRASCEEIKRAWSGSNLGYHATVYYVGFQPKPAGVEFSPEWGLKDVWPTHQPDPGWRTIDHEAVVREILSHAGSPDKAAIERELASIRDIFSGLKETAVSILSAILSGTTDSFIQRKLNEVENLQAPESESIALTLVSAGAGWSRDSLAVTQGRRIAPHQSLIALPLSGTVLENGIDSLEKAARESASHLRRLEGMTGALRDLEIGFVKGTDFVGTVKQEEWLTAAEALAMLKPILAEYSARLRICERAHGGLIRARAEQFHRGEQIFKSHGIPKEFWWADGHEALQQDWAAGDFSTWIDHKIHLKAFGVKFARADIEKLLPPQDRAKEKAVAHTNEDEEIIKKLDALVPSAALSYKQAVLDLSEENRVSFRGPALEFREALREILDHLAPDIDVKATPGYVQEKSTTGPTMRQKVRFIMKKKGERSSGDTPEQAVTAFEEAIASLTRAVYERSSKATHVAGERQAVVQIRRYVVAIFHDIL